MKKGTVKIFNIRTLTLVMTACLLLTTLNGCAQVRALRHEHIDAGMQFLEEGDYEGALSSFATALAEGESKRLLYRGRGIACYKMGAYEDAIAAFDTALKETSGIVDAADYDMNFYLADCYMKTDRAATAIATYTTILNLKDKDAEGYYLRGIARLKTGDLSGATEDFTRAIELSPADYDRLFLIRDAYADAGYHAEGDAMVRERYELAGETLSDYQKGRFLYYLNEKSEAVNALESARSGNGAEVIEAVLLLGRIAEEQGDYDYAEGIYRSYLKNNRENARVYNQLGLSELKSGRFDAAISDFESGLSLDDASMRQDLTWNIVVAYEHKGEFGTALERLNAYLERYPTDEKALREHIFLSTR